MKLSEKVLGMDFNKKIGEIIVNRKEITEADCKKAVLEQRYDRLKGCAIFEKLDAEGLTQVRDWVVEESVESDVELIEQDEYGKCFYILVSGQALVLRHGDYGENIPIL